MRRPVAREDAEREGGLRPQAENLDGVPDEVEEVHESGGHQIEVHREPDAEEESAPYR